MFRIGSGSDVHAFTKGNFITIGGIKIEHQQGIKAHSDGDVLLHAITDAILGSIAEGSIGIHFPSDDIKWYKAPSSIFITHAMSLLHQKGYVISNIDCTIICQEPKIMPYSNLICKNLSTLLHLKLNQINLKAFTTEKLGFIGRNEGIAAHAIVLIMHKNIYKDIDYCIYS